MNQPRTPAPMKRDFDMEETTVALLNKSEIEQQIATARKYPRSVKHFLNSAMEMVTLSEDIAQECIYSLPRDGKTIEGPSARFAEIIVSAWGNSRAGARVVNENGEFVTAQGVFHDLERNTAITFEVQRRIVNKDGRRYSHDMIGVTANAACSIALRNAILKGVPKAFWANLYGAARRTVMGDFKTLPSRRDAALEQFMAYGIDHPKVYKILGVKGYEDIGLEHLVALGGMLTALKDGDTTPEELVAKAQPAPEPPPAPKVEASPPPAPTEQPQPATPNGSTRTGEQKSKVELAESANVAFANAEHQASFDAQKPAEEHDPDTGDLPSEDGARLDNYDEWVADMEARLKAASDDEQGDIFNDEIAPRIEAGTVFPPDAERLKRLLRGTA